MIEGISRMTRAQQLGLVLFLLAFVAYVIARVG
jgi:hypothetical protein